MKIEKIFRLFCKINHCMYYPTSEPNMWEIQFKNGKYNSETYIINQWLGLLDDNGRMIFEGDIVETTIEGVKSIEVIQDLTNYITRDNGLDYDEIEIIGNIFENHELLEEK